MTRRSTNKLPATGELLFLQERIPNCCGIEDVGAFFYEDTGLPLTVDREVICSKTGYFISSYIDKEDQRVAYEYMKAEHHLVFQTKPMLSTTGRYVFLCVYLHRDRAWD